MGRLSGLMNIGAELERKLNSVGIDSAEALAEEGAKAAYMKLRETYPNVCMVHLYALEGALTNTEYNRLPEETKRELRELCDFLKGRG